jgi:hypothetical protein
MGSWAGDRWKNPRWPLGGPHAEFDAAAFEGRPGAAGGAGHPIPVADDDLGVGADIHEEGQRSVRYMPDPMTPATISPPT